MKFKKGDKVECISTCGEPFTKGKVYTVRENGLDKYGNIMIETNDKGSNTDGWCPEYFKLIEENKMKTDKKTMAKIYRKMADNLDKGLDENDSIQCSCGSYGWGDKNHVGINSLYQYRIKPETTTLKNGVTIPKHLDIRDVKSCSRYYKVSDSVFLYNTASAEEITYGKFKFIYATKEEAIEASKALFGIED